MDIVGVDDMVFGVEDFEAAKQFCQDFGLALVQDTPEVARYEAMDGTGVIIRKVDDPSLPAGNRPGSNSRLTIWGVKDQATLDAIAAELSKDRQITRDPDGSIQTVDDDNMGIAFRITRRREFTAPIAMQNGPGTGRQRPINHRVDFKTRNPVQSLGHVVFWTPDPDRSIKFYVERLGFKITDNVRNNQGVFARAQGSPDHHNIFFFGNPKMPPSFQHMEFHVTDVHEVLLGGEDLVKKGWKTAFGPGRHVLGSNWYWYFQTPMGGAFELGSDIDHVDNELTPGEWDSLQEVAGFSLSFLPPRVPSEARAEVEVDAH